jgi:hypothetical protein
VIQHQASVAEAPKRQRGAFASGVRQGGDQLLEVKRILKEDKNYF